MARHRYFQAILLLFALLEGAVCSGVAELVFLLDRSGSVGAAHFEAEKGFVESFLAQVAVHPNASRVALITYSDDAVVHVDYLREPKSKCELSEAMLGVEYADSRATNTRAALDKAREVLRNARPGVPKTVVLISDGVATVGGPPAEAAARLKAEGAELICVGVGREAKEELLKLASSPSHLFSCASFRDFRRLARQVRGDPHESSWSSSKDQGCGHLCESAYSGEEHDCCDAHARCACALQAGLRDCVCAPGYYGLSGRPGRCTPCPRGSYKSKLEPTSHCTPCPEGSTTVDLASTSLQQCVCEPGFRRDSGEQCRKVHCPPLQAPPRGSMACSGGSEFGSQCMFGCDVGFELAHPRLRVRTCLEDGSWDGRTHSCQRVQCGPPPSGVGLQVRCSQTQHAVGTRCRFSCAEGFVLLGAQHSECLVSKRWSGDAPSCQPVSCPLPPQLANGWSSCPTGRRPLFGEVCAFRCHHGFHLHGHPFLLCAADRSFRPPGPPPSCIDVQPPELLCPSSWAVGGELGGTLVDWTVPLPSDNGPQTPALTPVYPLPLRLGVGKHHFEYVATDAAGLSTSCRFTVVVYDDNPPLVLRCPPSVEVTAEGQQAPVFWEEPLFQDLSPFTVQQSRRPGEWFSLGEETVVYRATDDMGNTAECSFQVKVSQTSCPFVAAPANGALSCDDLLMGSVCGVSCDERFDFAEPPADLYVCDGRGRWVTDPPDIPMPWPDCTTAVSPGMVRLRARGFYFRGDCRHASTRAHIARQFAQRLPCFQMGSCSLGRIRVLCGRRVKRDLSQAEDFELEFEITLHEDLQLNETEAVLQDFLEAIQHLGWEEDEEEATTPSPEANRTVVISEERAEVVCRPGSVLSLNKCMLCPSGTFFAGGRCEDCPLGHFQEQEGQLACEPCPANTSTIAARARNRTDCRGLCPPGTFSESGLMSSCVACPVGTFQPLPGQRECQSCLPPTTTHSAQATSPEDCRERCAAGYFSESGGLAPCLPCPVGFFQPSPEQSLCMECPGNLSTLAEAATDAAQCQEVDPCPPDWCLQGGTCEPEGRGAFCHCPPGWQGRRCEQDLNECASDPCRNGASCLNTEGSFMCSCSEGFTGTLCQEELDECLSSPCLNKATCLDEVNGFRCECATDYWGARCEHLLCSQLACLNGASCEGDVCVCAQGYSGPDCSLEIDECESVVCEHNGSCVNGSCACAPGYTGALCEEERDECAEGHQCAEGATCQDLVDAYECLCPPGWAGRYCQTRLSEDFVLNFAQASLANTAQLRLRSTPLAQATVSLWVQTRGANGAPLSYATGARDNALAVAQCSALTLALNNEPLLTDVAVSDGRWHHLAFAYDQAGWQLWKDGALASEGRRQEGGVPVEGGGVLVLGQEQDSLGGDFSPSETFTGNISRVNMWSEYLSPENVTRLCQLDDDLPDRVVAWPDFLAGVSGDVQVLDGQLPTLSS